MGHHLTPPPDVAAWLADQRARGTLPTGFLHWWHRLTADMPESTAGNRAPRRTSETVGMKVREVAQLTGYSCRWLRNLAEAGHIRAWQPGGTGTGWRIDIASVWDYHAGGRREQHMSMDIIGVLACADRGDYTMPDNLIAAYRAYAALPKGQERDQAAAAIQRGAPAGDQLIADHITPSLDQLMSEIAANVATLGSYAHTDSPPPDLLTAPAKVRTAYLDLDPLVTRYRNIRAGWRALRSSTIDPLGLDSPLAEIVDIDQHCPGWENAHTGRGYWPWGHGDRLKLAWAVTSGARLWTPTEQQHDDAWRIRWEDRHGTAHRRNPTATHQH